MALKDAVKNMHIGFPRNYIALTRGFTSTHKGIDMAWNSNYGGQNAPVFAPYDGEVVAIKDGMGNTYSTGVSNWGNYIKIKHATNVYTLSAHLLKNSLLVKVGDKVTRGQMIAKMNNSGYSNGSHVHFELYIGGSATSYRVDPLLYCCAYPNDIVNASTQKEYNILHYDPITYVGTPVARDAYKDQIEVIKSDLRGRASPSTNGKIVGYMNKGFYNVLDMQNANGYTWYNVEKDLWCASAGATYYPKQEEPKYRVTFENVTDDVAKSLQTYGKALGATAKIEEM